MPGLKWWDDDLKSELSQGDVLSPLPFAVVADPPFYLKLAPTPRAGQQTLWLPDANPQVTPSGSSMRFLGRDHPAIVISHDCAIDKKAKGRILVAQLVAQAVYEPAIWQTIVEQKHLSLLPLVDVPGLGNFAADMRTISMVPRSRLDAATRHASMTDAGVLRLYAQISKFLFRRDLFPEPGED